MDANRLGQPSRADLAALETLRGKLMSLWRPLVALEHDLSINPQAPLHWPEMQKRILQQAATINSIQSLLYDDPKITEIFRKFHPYAAPPFQFENPAFAVPTESILRKKPELDDENWVADRLAKAQEFAHVPADWNIEPRKPTDEADDGDANDDDAGEEALFKRRFKRQRGVLNEDQLLELWGDASRLANDEFAKVLAAEADVEASSGSGSEASSPEDTKMGGMETESGAGVAKKAVERAPTMGLSVLHKFMCTGMVEKPKTEEPVL